MTPITSALALLIAALAVLSVSAPVSVRAQGTQITISQPAEATTMDPGRSTQVLTVNYFYQPLRHPHPLGHRRSSSCRASPPRGRA